jgi:hypothetical protein
MERSFFFKHEASHSADDADDNIFFVGGIPGYFDPFVDNEIDLDADATPASKLLSDDKVPDSFSSKSPYIPDVLTSSSKAAFI